MLRNYRRNEQLVDLAKVPNSIAEEVLNQYETKGNGREKLMNYPLFDGSYLARRQNLHKTFTSGIWNLK